MKDNNLVMRLSDGRLATQSFIFKAPLAQDYKQFSVIAHLGGVSFALACAHSTPDRLTAVAIVSGLASINLPESIQDRAKGPTLYRWRAALLERCGMNFNTCGVLSITLSGGHLASYLLSPYTSLIPLKAYCIINFFSSYTQL